MSDPIYIEGTLFDIYHIEDKIHLWLRTQNGESILFHDFYQPVIYARGEESVLKKLVQRFYELDALADIPTYVPKTLFYENVSVQVLKLTISRPSLLSKVSKKLYALYGKFDIYHSDIEVSTSYMVEKKIFPLCKLRIYYAEGKFGKRIHTIETDKGDEIEKMEYEIPDFRILSMKLVESHRIDMKDNSILFHNGDRFWEFSGKNPKDLLIGIDRLLKTEDPDIILSSFGDQVIFPYLFTQAQRLKIFPAFDRDRSSPIRRNIRTQGTSFNTYGTIVYRAPSYPLFGRWHIDAENSFVHKEADLLGIVELARLSRLPIQKMARASTGKALTSIETDVALRRGYLVPWQKSAIESPKTALQLLEADKGGLVFQPDISFGMTAENVAQLDFAQMYPSIMVIHNISPECVNCSCCAEDPDAPTAPGLGYKICRKRIGIVSEALKHVLDRRAYYKNKTKEIEKANRDVSYAKKLTEYDLKQSSLKWMLVTSFGYLGYRNAKFGRLESHESVNAFAREKLLTAKEIAEERGYVFIHAITDSIFIRKENSSSFSEEELESLCSEIGKRTSVKIDVDGIYTWLLFPASSQDPQMPVANRYMGRFTSGKLKCRGIGARRKDLPIFIRNAQKEMLEWMQNRITIADLKNSESEILRIYDRYDSDLKSEKVPLEELLIRKSTSKELEEYEVAGPTAVSLHNLKEMGISVQAGEKIRYLVLNRKAKNKDQWYLPEEMIPVLKRKNQKIHLDRTYYRKLLIGVFREIWSEFASFQNFESLIDEQRWLPFELCYKTEYEKFLMNQMEIV
ncbi:DNA polymerase domain-containing protein [Leptospira alstonii]|uniref:DNA-directed DNA polymerase n=2 Tax=Leptospira alstonii TaxID=28452 RepID=M6CLH3_9LEPT|nr:DNA polymerase domain-containing protein [Leptospira alstonii]EMJ92792.1 DNA polymerase family B [Leptospira alstonii serovar Sichuan str. 79601]EQA78945.1 DNA polymerase family B [Leptospira alstonii serovar Pingchang str. 80-412]